MYPTIPIYALEAPPFPVAFIVEESAVITKKSRTKTEKFAISLAIFGLLLLLVSYGPSIFYSLLGSGKVTTLLRNTVSAHALPTEKKYSYQPAFDSNLPVTNSIYIPSINVKTTIEEAKDENFEDALKNGVWRVNSFGTPYNREQATILAAHRFGYLNWSLDFRLHNSFYNLPKTKVEDVVEIIWRQRKYVYGVYKTERSKEIADYNADLILYTCEDLTSDMKVFVYAKLLEV